MRRIMAATKKIASRVADEDIAAASMDTTRSPSSSRSWNINNSFLCGNVLASLISLFSCLSTADPCIDGRPDGFWVSADAPQTSSERTHLMVRDSLRYAILM